MNIVHLSINPLAGVPIKLANMINQHTEHTARAISVNDAYGKRLFDSDFVFDKRNEVLVDQANDLLSNADVVHIHNYYHDIQTRLKPINLKKHLRYKKVCTQFHQVAELTASQLGISIQEIPKTINTPILAIANQQALTYSGATIVPIVVPLQDPQHCMLSRKESQDDGVVRIAYTPSVTRLRGTTPLYQKYFDKGYNETKAVLDRICQVFGNQVKIQIVRNQPHRDCLHVKQRADIAIDEVKTGSYHTSTLETLSQGVVSIVNPSEGVQNVVKRLTGAKSLPWEIANLNTLFDVLGALINDQNVLRAKQRYSRQWMEQYWNDEYWASWFMENVYERL